MRAEPPRYGLRGRIIAIDAVDDPLQFERRKRPVDRGPPPSGGIPLATKSRRNTPAAPQRRPARRIKRADPSDERAACLLFDHEHAEAMQPPMSRHDRSVAPA